jgi:hypothetical protein
VELQPKLIDVRVPDDPAGVVLLLHGGGARRTRMMVSPAQLSVLRMIPVGRRIARAGRGRLAVFRLLNSRRGWDSRHTPVHDAVALAPWVLGTDVPADFAGRRVLIVHGTRDRIASAERSAALARVLATRADVGYVSVQGGTHAMLRHHATFDGLAARFATTTLLGEPGSGVLARIEAGERWVTA